mgnify:CR=1 FL=1
MVVESQIERIAKRIKGATCLRGNVIVSFPKLHPKKGTELKEQLEAIRRVMSEAFGGTTEWDGFGCWVSEVGKTICEPVRVYYSAHMCFKDSDKALQFFKTLKRAGIEADQEAVFINVEGTSYIFSPKKIEGIEEELEEKKKEKDKQKLTEGTADLG